MKRVLSSIVCSTLILSSTPVWMAPSQTEAASADVISYQQPINVKLITGVNNVSQLSFSLTNEYVLKNSNTSLSAGNYVIKNANNQLTLSKDGSPVFTGASILIEPASYDANHMLKIGSYTYLGTFEFKTEGAFVRPFNTLEFEDYLKGVVPFEMSNSWPLEALKAQAVTARTYVLKKGTMSLDNTQNNQVYLGYNPNNHNSNRAVDETRGSTLKYGNAYAGTYYSSANGGTVLSVTNSWGTALSSYPYLTKKDDPYSRRSGQHLNWSFALNAVQIDTSSLDLASPDAWWNTVSELDSSMINSIKSKIVPSGSEYKITSISDIVFKSEPYTATDILTGGFTIKYFEKLSTGYVTSVDPTTQQTVLMEQTRTISGVRNDTLRSYYGSVMKSPNVSSVDFDGTKYTVTGNGWGHGIGMSQWGANQMAVEGKNYIEILSFYFPGTTITAAETVPPLPSEPDPEPVYQKYTVVSGDTLYSISRRFNLSVTEIQQMNNMTTTVIHVGQVLIVGVQEAPPPADVTAPVLSNFSAAVNATNQVTVKFTVNETSSIKVTADTNTVIKQASHVSGTYSFVWDASHLSAGSHTIKVTATDDSGNSSNTAKNVTLVTLVSPEITNITPAVSDKKLTLSYTLNKTAKVTVLIQKNGQTVSTPVNSSLNAGNHQIIWSGSDYGSYTYKITAVDSLNRSDVKTGSFQLVDALLPKLTNQSVLVSGSSATIKFTTNKPSNVTVSVLKNGSLVKTLTNASLSTGAHQISWIASASGTYTYKVKMTDSSNRTHEVSQNFTVTVPVVQNKYYTVVRGDTLWSISVKHKMSVDQIKSWNNLKTNTLYVGQKLIVGKTAGTSNPPPTSPSTPPPAETANKYYTVVRGDTLWGISRKFGVSVSYLQTKNKLKTNVLYTGQKLIVGTTTTSSSGITPPPVTTPSSVVYTVKSGDTLWGISQKYDVSVAQIMSKNNMNSTVLKVGQTLKIK